MNDVTHRDWTGKRVAIIGGDRREQEIARAAAATGATVRAFGFPWPDGGIDRVTLASSPREAATGADIVLLPLPGMTGNTVFSPQVAAPVVVDRAVLEGMAPGGLVMGGTANAPLTAAINDLGLTFVGYEHDEAGRIARAPAIAEGAIARIITDTDFTIRGAAVAQIGYGVVGQHVATALKALGAKTHVLARQAAQQDAARAAGHLASSLPAPEVLSAADILVNTAPALVVDEAVLMATRPDCVIFDLASPPGGVDRDAAARLGRRFVWARGLGATAPQSVGRAQWDVIARIAEGHLFKV
ncbi:MAG: dipicolinate synthase subunit DpsA [Variibacter sp.]